MIPGRAGKQVSIRVELVANGGPVVSTRPTEIGRCAAHDKGLSTLSRCLGSADDFTGGLGEVCPTRRLQPVDKAGQHLSDIPETNEATLEAAEATRAVHSALAPDLIGTTGRMINESNRRHAASGRPK